MREKFGYILLTSLCLQLFLAADWVNVDSSVQGPIVPPASPSQPTTISQSTLSTLQTLYFSLKHILRGDLRDDFKSAPGFPPAFQLGIVRKSRYFNRKIAYLVGKYKSTGKWLIMNQHYTRAANVLVRKQAKVLRKTQWYFSSSQYHHENFVVRSSSDMIEL